MSKLFLSLSSIDLGLDVTVVDNSPTDVLRPVAVQNAARYLFVGTNVGFGAANNLVFRQSLSIAPYQLVLNPDVLIEPNVLDRLCQFMEEHPNVGQVMPAVVSPDGTEQRLTKRLPTPLDLSVRRFLGGFGKHWAPTLWARYEMRDLDMTVTREVPCLSGCFMLLRSSVLEQVGLFDERFFMYMEDVDLCRRIGDVSKTVFYPHVRVVHGYAKESYSNPRLFFHHVRSAILYFFKHGWIWDRERKLRNRQAGTVVTP